ncbi:hypothetical protein [Streptomyces sp. NPDC058308]|uniref:TetR/AcrR family transcriptional regulator n=1 Tax=Streptomyces sp. NPDC058308 TaxID=3346440 RepID=UPI0036EEADFC
MGNVPVPGDARGPRARLAVAMAGSNGPTASAAPRAELAVGMLLGLSVVYGIARGPHVRGAEIGEITGRYAPAVQAFLTPP